MGAMGMATERLRSKHAARIAHGPTIGPGTTNTIATGRIATSGTHTILTRRPSIASLARSTGIATCQGISALPAYSGLIHASGLMTGVTIGIEATIGTITGPMTASAKR